MSVEVQAVHQVTGELVDAAGRLLPQLSKSAAELDAEGLARIAKHQATTLFVARSQDVIVGMLTLVTFPLPSGLRARIEDVVVDQDARGQGVGTALTMAAIAQAQAQGARSIDLTSRVAANRLYTASGPAGPGRAPAVTPASKHRRSDRLHRTDLGRQGNMGQGSRVLRVLRPAWATSMRTRRSAAEGHSRRCSRTSSTPKFRRSPTP
jgi:GNAT superfamily N-acetyltransferase